ncbi:DUF1465 family protein [Altererythrobacter indicus]|uniref:DUF1465 family protein n=1 Tax=Altericroceibacterium indicum TaxID=374177 RepID=A0A845ABK1_9SPHN|nr:DUF1465 family protein [Altericroceibacterium indicum]MXP24558.1 DUF1465 family protein [Altericroceibacterium indicum]
MKKHTMKLHATIIESLYLEAITLAEEARVVFEYSDIIDNSDDIERSVALARQITRSRTLLMNVLAWLLNHKACLDGELSEQELRHYCRLKKPTYLSEKLPEIFLLPQEMQDLAQHITALHNRVERLDMRASLPLATPLRLRRLPQNFAPELIALP